MRRRRRFEWNSLLERLRLTQETAQAQSLSPLDTDRLLASRALSLARPAEQPAETENATNVVIFRVGADRFAFPLSDLIEIVAGPRVAAVPGAPPEVAGLIQLRGDILPAYRLPLLLLLKETGETKPEFLLVLRAPSGLFGICADAMEDIQPIPPGRRKQVPGGRGHAGWATDDLVPVLSAQTLLQRED